jgi:2-phosphoglycerate kinase
MTELVIQRGSVTVPFSRGILSRSLRNIGLDDTRAYDIASRIYKDLLDEGVSVLSTQHLSRILSQRISQYAGDDLGNRWERLRLFKRSTRPLVLLVGGSTGSGKSTIATEVAHRLDITRIQSTDSIRHVMRSVVAQPLVPSIHRSSFEPSDANTLSQDRNIDPTIMALEEQVRHVAVAVNAVLERAVQENLSTILEGVHLVPGLFERFAQETRLQFVHVVVHVADETEHRNRFLSRGRASAGRPGKRYLKHFETIRTIQGYLVEQAQQRQLPCIDNQSINGTVDAVLGHVLEGIAPSTPWMPPALK